MNLYAYVGGNPINWIDPEGLDFLDCLADCIKANDPLELIYQKILLSISGMKLSKSFVARLADLAGDKKLARLIRQQLRNPNMSRVTSLPASLSAALRAPGMASKILHGVGAGMGPFWLSYGLYMAAVETACIGHCSAGDCYDSSLGILLPIDVNALINTAIDGFTSNALPQ